MKIFFLEKLNKRDYILVKLYGVINLFNCFSKIFQKLFPKKLLQFYIANNKFYKEKKRKKASISY